LDIKFIRENPEKVKQGAKNKGVDIDMEKLLGLDKKDERLSPKPNSSRQSKIN